MNVFTCWDNVGRYGGGGGESNGGMEWNSQGRHRHSKGPRQSNFGCKRVRITC